MARLPAAGSYLNSIELCIWDLNLSHEKVIREQKSSTKRQFSTLFKQQAVERADKDGVAQAAKDLGIKPSLIYNWRHSLTKRSSEHEEIKLIRAENARLKRELNIAQDDLTFLKKAAAYFANPQK